MTSGETELEMVERHVRQGQRRLANQRQLIAHLGRQGLSIELAQRLLNNLEEVQELHLQHLARIQGR